MILATKIAILGGLASTALAHGTVWGYTTDGVYHENNHPNPEAGKVVGAAGWYSENFDRGFVSTGDYESPDIICHRNARPSENSATVAAGGTVKFHWTPWAESHMGPAFTYVANCHGNCSDVEKETLEWVKIDEEAFDAETREWANVKMISTNNTWTTTVPETLAPGNYVFRHEIIAIYGKQHYPSCINIEITGDGTDEPEGVIGTELYHEGDSTGAEENYNIPGPPLYTPSSSPSASESAQSDVDPEFTIPAQSTAPDGTGASIPALSAAPTGTGSSILAQSATPTGTGISSAAPVPTSAVNIESSAVPSTTSRPSTDRESATAEPSRAPTDEVIPKPEAPSATPCASKRARRHVRDMQI